MSSKIYKITNLINNKIYIGYTKKSLEERLRYHFYYAKHGKLPLSYAIKKYGKENFKIELIEESENDSYIHKEREKYWIDRLNSRNPKIGYNVAAGGDGGDTLSKNPKKDEIYKKLNARRIGGKVCYNPETGEHLRLERGVKIPEGFIQGFSKEWRLHCNSREGIAPANKGTTWSDEKRVEISRKTKEAMAKLPRKTCSFCKKEIISCSFDRHVAGCKMNPNKHGPKYYIMKITNTITNRILIDWHRDYSDGIDNSLGNDIYMKEAINIFGRKVFKKDIIEYCTKENKEERKKYWIEYFHSNDLTVGFNKKVML